MLEDENQWLLNRLDRIERKLDDSAAVRDFQHIANVQIQAEHTAALKEHMRRTDLLEGVVNSWWRTALSVLGVAVGAAVGLAKLLGY